METSLTKCFIGQHVYATINYFKQLSGTMTVHQEGWLLYNKHNNTYTLAFYTNHGDLDFLPTFDHDEISRVEVLDSDKLDMNLVAPEWRVDVSEWKIVNNTKDGMTVKGAYQTSGMNWL